MWRRTIKKFLTIRQVLSELGLAGSNQQSCTAVFDLCRRTRPCSRIPMQMTVFLSKPDAFLNINDR